MHPHEKGSHRRYRAAGWPVPCSGVRPLHVWAPRRWCGWSIVNQPGMKRFRVDVEGGRNHEGRPLALRSMLLWAWTKREALDAADESLRRAGFTFRRLVA